MVQMLTLGVIRAVHSQFDLLCETHRTIFHCSLDIRLDYEPALVAVGVSPGSLVFSSYREQRQLAADTLIPALGRQK